jgi:hypothetical protein
MTTPPSNATATMVVPVCGEIGISDWRDEDEGPPTAEGAQLPERSMGESRRESRGREE